MLTLIYKFRFLLLIKVIRIQYVIRQRYGPISTAASKNLITCQKFFGVGYTIVVYIIYRSPSSRYFLIQILYRGALSLYAIGGLPSLKLPDEPPSKILEPPVVMRTYLLTYLLTYFSHDWPVSQCTACNQPVGHHTALSAMFWSQLRPSMARRCVLCINNDDGTSVVSISALQRESYTGHHSVGPRPTVWYL